MPLYEYKCVKRKHVFEKIQKFSDKPEAECPQCGSAGERQLSAPAVHFKGTGWYVTDYARKGKKDGESETKEASQDKASPDKTSPDKTKTGDSATKKSTATAKKKD